MKKLKEKNNKKRIFNGKKIKLDAIKEITDYPKFNSLTVKHSTLKEKTKLRPVSSKFSANINNYRFLFDIVNKESVENNKWVLNLRTFEDLKKKKKKLLGEPSFYQADLDKFIKKRRNRLIKSKSAFEFNTLANFTQYKHFFKRNNGNHGTMVTTPLLKYKMNLRNYNLSLSTNKWNSNTHIENDKYFYSCSNFYKDKLQGKISDKIIMRPYKIEFSKGEYNGNQILIKKAKRDRIKAYDIMGDHLASKPYNDKYTEKNMYQINEILDTIGQSQARTWYHIKLRNNNDNKKEVTNKKRWKNW